MAWPWAGSIPCLAGLASCRRGLVYRRANIDCPWKWQLLEKWRGDSTLRKSQKNIGKCTSPYQWLMRSDATSLHWRAHSQHSLPHSYCLLPWICSTFQPHFRCQTRNVQFLWVHDLRILESWYKTGPEEPQHVLSSCRDRTQGVEVHPIWLLELRKPHDSELPHVFLKNFKEAPRVAVKQGNPLTPFGSSPAAGSVDFASTDGNQAPNAWLRWWQSGFPARSWSE